MKPPPNDRNAERRVASAVLLGQIPPTKVHGADFMDPICRGAVAGADVVLSAGLRLSVLRVAMAMEALGMGACERHLQGLVALASTTPFRVDLRSSMGRVRDAARRRRLLRWGHGFMARVRSGELDANKAAAELLAVARRA